MSTWRRRFTRKSQRLPDNDGVLISNGLKYRKKLQTAITQIHRTKKFVQKNLDSSESEIHVARLINDIGQLSDCKPLQEIGGFIDSLAMRHQLSSRIFNEYAMNALQQSLEKLNDHLNNNFENTTSLYEDASNNHCSDHTRRQLLSKVQDEWVKHQKLAMKELKHGLSSYCDVGLYNLKIQIAILEKLQTFVDQLPHTDDDENTGLPDFAANSLQARRDIDTMLRIMLDAAPTDPALLPNTKQPKFLSNQMTLSNTLFSPEITEAAAARSQGQSLRQQNNQYPPMSSASSPVASAPVPDNDSISDTPTSPRIPVDDRLPSYTDLFIVPANCKGTPMQRPTRY